MKLLPKISALSLALFLTAAIVIVADTGCAPKPGCGSKRDHRIRKKRVKKFAPSMSYGMYFSKKSKEIIS